MFKAIWLGLGLAFIWGSNFPLSQIGIEQIGSVPYRLATIIISTVILISLSFNELNTYLKKLSLNDCIFIALLAIPNIFLVPLINNISLAYLSITKATILVYMMPCFVSILVMISEKKSNVISVVATLLCLSGITVLSGLKGFSFGESLMVLNAFIWAIGAFMSKKIKLDHIPMRVVVCIQMIITLVMTLVTSLIWGKIDTSIMNEFSFNTLMKMPVILSVLYVGAIGSALAYYLWFTLIKLKSAEFTSYATLLSPVISIVMAVTLFNEELKVTTMIGGTLILLSSCMIIIKPLFEHQNRTYSGLKRKTS